MKQRCANPNKPDYKWYGAKGIKVCDEWKDSEHGLEKFYNWSINNGYSDNLTIDRIDSNGDYEPSNCRWVSLNNQQSNKSNNVLIYVNGEEITAKKYCEINNINYHSFMSRLNRGWSLDKTILTPYRNR